MDVSIVDGGLKSARLSPEGLATIGVTRVEGLEAPAPQVPHLGGVGARRRRAGLRVGHGGRDLAIDLGVPPHDELPRDEHASERDAEQGRAEQTPALLDGRIVLERRDERHHRRITRLALDGEPAHDGAPEPRWHLAVPGQRPEVPARDAHRERQEGVSLEGSLAEERLVERDAEAELVGALVGRLAEELLGRHVRGRAHERARARELVELVRRAHVDARREVRVVLRRLERGAGVFGSVFLGGVVDVRHRAPEIDRAAVLALGLGGLDVAREPEVDDARAAVLVEQDVVGLEVAVNEALGVRRRESPSRGHEDGDDLAPRARLRLEPGVHRAARQKLGREEHAVILGDADIVHGGDIRVRQARHGLRLAHHARARERCDARADATQELERDLAIELRIVGAVHDTHRAVSDALEDHVASDVRADGQVGLARLDLTVDSIARHALPLLMRRK